MFQPSSFIEIFYYISQINTALITTCLCHHYLIRLEKRKAEQNFFRSFAKHLIALRAALSILESREPALACSQIESRSIQGTLLQLFTMGKCDLM
jgi:hypothetical protein